MEKEKVSSLQEIISSHKKVIESFKYNKQEEITDKSKKILKCRYWNRGYCREGNNCNFTHKKKIVKYILKQGNVKTEPVKEDTEEFANTTIHKKDASEKTTVNTSMSTKEEKKFQ